MTRRQKVFLAAAAGTATGLALWWRYAARRRSLPCPASLAGLLDHPFSHLVPPSLDKLELAPGLKVLDAGCGPGRLTLPVARAVAPGGIVVALDLQPGMLRRLEQRIEHAGIANVHPLLADLTRPPLPANNFDRALLVTVLGEIPDRAAALGAIFDALKPGGILSITEILPDPHYQRRTTVLRLAAEAGFELDREYSGLGHFTVNLRKPDVIIVP